MRMITKRQKMEKNLKKNGMKWMMIMKRMNKNE